MNSEVIFPQRTTWRFVNVASHTVLHFDDVLTKTAHDPLVAEPATSIDPRLPRQNSGVRESNLDQQDINNDPQQNQEELHETSCNDPAPKKVEEIVNC